MQLLYNVVLVSAVQRSESAICIHKSLPFWVSLLLSHLTILSHHRAPSWAPYDIQQPPTSYLFTHGSVYMSMLLSIHLLLSFTITHPCPNQQVHSLHLCLYSCPANRLIITIFHDSMCLVAQSCLTLCDPMDCSPAGSSVHGNSPGKNTGVGCHAFLQEILPTQGWNPGLPYCRRILYHLRKQGSPKILEQVANPFSWRSSHPRNQTGISWIAGVLFTSWANREAW